MEMSVVGSCVESCKDTSSRLGLRSLDPVVSIGLKDTHSEPLSILVISSQEFCLSLMNKMLDVSSEQYDGNIKIKLAEDINQVLESGIKSTSIDYVVLVCDTTMRNYKEQILNNLDLLRSLLSTKVCIVNGSPKDGIDGSSLEVLQIAESYNLLYINEQIREEKGCKRAAERVLGLAAASCGYFTGIPFIFPTAPEVFAQLHQS